MHVLPKLHSNLCQDSVGWHRKQVPGWLNWSGSACCCLVKDILRTQSIICVGYLQGTHKSFSCVEEWVIGSSVLPCLVQFACAQGSFLRLCWEGVLERAGCMLCMKWGFSQSAGMWHGSEPIQLQCSFTLKHIWHALILVQLQVWWIPGSCCTGLFSRW